MEEIIGGKKIMISHGEKKRREHNAISHCLEEGEKIRERENGIKIWGKYT